MSSPSEVPKKRFRCGACGHVIEVPYGIPKPVQCPKCGAPAMIIHRVDKGPGRRRGRRGWRGGRGGS